MLQKLQEGTACELITYRV